MDVFQAVYKDSKGNQYFSPCVITENNDGMGMFSWEMARVVDLYNNKQFKSFTIDHLRLVGVIRNFTLENFALDRQLNYTAWKEYQDYLLEVAEEEDEYSANPLAVYLRMKLADDWVNLLQFADMVSRAAFLPSFKVFGDSTDYTAPVPPPPPLPPGSAL